MKQKYIFLGVVAIVIIPFLLNLILGMSNPIQSINIIGDEHSWLGFYGSYIGGTLTAVVAFVALYQETKRNRLLLEIRSKEDALKELKLALSERIGLFNFSKVTEISLFPYDEKMYTIIQRELNEYLYQLTSKANGWAVVYAIDQSSIIMQFRDAYVDCWEIFDENIKTITNGICLLQDIAIKEAQSSKYDLSKEGYKDYDVRKKEIVDEYIDSVIKQNKVVNSKIKNLYNMAQSWINAEEKDIAELKAQL